MKLLYTITLLILISGTFNAQSANTITASGDEKTVELKQCADQNMLRLYKIFKSVFHVRSYPNISPCLCRLDLMPEYEAETVLIINSRRQIAHQSPIINIKWKTEPTSSQTKKTSSY